MHHIALLGLGAMGSRMAQAILRQGYPLQVWNRNPERAAPLITAGAVWAETPAAAAADADIVISMVRDDAASQQIWLDPQTGACTQLREHSIAIECATLSLDWVRQLQAQFQQGGRALLGAPVVGSLAQAEAAQLIQFVGGEEHLVERVRPLLACCSSQIIRLPELIHSFQLKLLVNGLLALQLTGLAEILNLAEQWGLAPAVLQQCLGVTPVLSPVAKNTMGAMLERTYTPMFPLALALKDLNYLLGNAAEAPRSAPLLEQCRASFSATAAAGWGSAHLSAIREWYGGQTSDHGTHGSA